MAEFQDVDDDEMARLAAAADGLGFDMEPSIAGACLIEAVHPYNEEEFKDSLALFSGYEAALNWAGGEESRTCLHVACNHGNVEAIRLLVATPGVDIEAVDDGGLTPVMVATKMGRGECLRLLVAAGCEVNKRAASDGGKSPLLIAADKGHIECVRALCTVPSTDIHLLDTTGYSAMGNAVQGGYGNDEEQWKVREEILATLQQAGATYHASEYVSVIRAAVYQGRASIYTALIPLAGNVVNYYYSPELPVGEGPVLWNIIQKGRVDAFRLMAATPDIDLNVTDYQGRNALHFAVQAFAEEGDANAKEIASILLNSTPGFDINKRATEVPGTNMHPGYSPLGEAISYSLKYPRVQELIDLLREAKCVMSDEEAGTSVLAHINSFDYGLLTAVLAEYRGNSAVINFALPNDDDEPVFPLFAAVTRKNLEALKLLVATEGIDLHKYSKVTGRTALGEAEANGLEEFSAVLRAAGAVRNEGDAGTAVWLAVFTACLTKTIPPQLGPLLEEWRGNKGVLNYCRMAKQEGATPLIIAACQRQIDVVRLLLATEGVDVNQRVSSDLKGVNPALINKTALGMAIMASAPAEIIDLLREAEAQE